MEITNGADLTHIARTTEQWSRKYDRHIIIPKGVLCIEFTPSGETKIKIGDGHKVFAQLPYIGNSSSVIIDAYTKDETDNRILQLLDQEQVVRIKGYLNNVSQLPDNAKCGDLWFVIHHSPEHGNRYEEYIYTSKNTWELIGGTPIEIDLSDYATKEYVDNKLKDIDTHHHDNKDILDDITAPFTQEEKEKLESLNNYDDTELIKLIESLRHTHLNKDVLDKLTQKDLDKLRKITEYDDSTLKKKILELEKLSHDHSNKDILDKITAPFTREDARKLLMIREYIGATGFEGGVMGLVPPAGPGEQNYILTGSGKWIPNTGGGSTPIIPDPYKLPIASQTVLGGIKIGDGLEISQDGTVSVDIEEKPIPIYKDTVYDGGDAIYINPTGGTINAYEQLEYIESNGSQMIETDISTIGTKHEIKMKYQYTELTPNNIIFSIGPLNNTGSQVYGILPNSNKLSSGVGNGTSYTTTSTTPTLDITEDTYTIDTTSFGSTLTGTSENNIILNDNISLFGIVDTQNTSSYVRIYSIEVKCDDVITADLIPVKRISDNQIGLYDKISNKFFINTNTVDSFIPGPVTGEIIDEIVPSINVQYGNGLYIDDNNLLTVKLGKGFQLDKDGTINVINSGGGGSSGSGIDYVAGDGINIEEKELSEPRLPEEFQEVEYIRGTGTQYITTDVVLLEHDKIETDVKLPFGTYENEWLFGSRNGESLTGSYEYIYKQTDPGVVVYIRNEGDTTSLGEVPLNEKIKITTIDDNITINSSNGETTLTTLNGTSGDTVNNLMIFTCNTSPDTTTNTPLIDEDSGPGSFELYSFNIYRDDQLIREYVPCYRKSDNKTGLYDLVTDTFIESQVDEFELGNDVLPPTISIINIDYGDGLNVNEDNQLSVKVGDGLRINDNGDVTIDITSEIFNNKTDVSAGEAITITNTPIRLNPIMTDFTTPSGEVIYRGQYDNRYAWLAFDGIDNQNYYPNAWCGGDQYKLDGSPDTCYVGYMFEEPVIISYFSISFYSDRDYHGCIQIFKNNEWITIKEIDINGNAQRYLKYPMIEINPTKCEGFRFSMLSGYNNTMGTSSYGSNVIEFEAYGITTEQHEKGTIVNVNYGNGLTVNEDNQLTLDIGDNLEFDEDGKIKIVETNYGNGIEVTVDEEGNESVNAKIGNGLQFDENGAIELTPVDPPPSTSYKSGEGIDIQETTDDDGNKTLTFKNTGILDADVKENEVGIIQTVKSDNNIEDLDVFKYMEELVLNCVPDDE